MAVAAVLAPGAAWAHAADSAVAGADDAFGAAVGGETVGIYSETDVRGFNPQKAGNARLDDVYFDQFATLAQRARASYAIRVGLTAANEPSPAPSGIVAYRARTAGDERRISSELNISQYGYGYMNMDAEIPIVRDHFGVAFGFAVGKPHYSDDSKVRNYPFAVIPRIRFGTVEMKPFVSGLISHDAQTRPLITTTGPFLPPMPRDRHYLGQTWAGNRTGNYNSGVVAHAEPAPGLLLRGGFVRSRIDRKRNFTEIFYERDAAGLSTHYLLADPHQNSYADSWNLFAAYRFATGDLVQTVHADVRSRHRHVESGGTQTFNFGDVLLGDVDPEPKPAFTFSALTVGSLDQRTYSAGYKGAFRNLAQVNLGVTRSHYVAEANGPLGRTRTTADPWLYNASLLVRPAPRLTLYAGYVSGLEDTGVAPENAANRNQQLPASSTRQIDAGLQWRVGRIGVVATAFQLTKPYFSFDGAGNFVQLANLRHRGFEVSASGDVTGDLHVLVGAVVMDPRVTGPARATGLVGPRPVGTPAIHARLDATLRIRQLAGAQVSLAVQHDSRRAASTAGYAPLGGRQLFVPARTTVDLGARRNFQLGDTPVSVRLLVTNVLNSHDWKVLAPNTFQLDELRRATVLFVADF